MNQNVARCHRALNAGDFLILLTLAMAVAQTAVAAVTVQTLHSYGQGGPGFVQLLQAADGNLYGTTFTGGAYTNGTVFQFPLGGSATTLYSFTGGSDGGDPEGNLAQASDGNLYGTTRYGGSSSNGTAFRISTSGTLTTIYAFSGGADGGTPRSGLMLGKDGNFYGTTINGGAHSSGTVFKMTTNGTLTTLYSFTGGTDGANPHTALIQGKDGGLYGTTFAGGTSGSGTIFRVTTAGAFSRLYSFTGGNDGGTPDANLLQASDENLYGTTTEGGAGSNGDIFRIGTNGGSFSNLYSFTGGNDGASPLAGLIQPTNGNPNGTLYGTTYYAGASGAGTIFQISTKGAFTNLYSFSGGSDGNEPFSDLVQASDTNLYGTTFIGGGTDSGEMFSVSLAGTFTPVYSFPGAGDGANPDCNLFQAKDGNYYGTTVNGGANNSGTIFEVNSNGFLTTLYSFAGGSIAGSPMAGVVQAGDGTFYGTSDTGAGAIFQMTTNRAVSLPYIFSGSFDGGGPNAVVVGNDGNLYGTAYGGGADSLGTVFQYPLPSGSGTVSILHTFTGTNDGGNPVAGLIQASDGNFYGTTSDFNLQAGYGTIFRIAPDGTFKTIYTFTNGLDGNSPLAPLMQASDGNLYGTASDYGTGDTGTVFRVTTNGVFTELYAFGGTTDGSEPYAGLVQGKDGNLYGSTWLGGDNNAGALFEITTNGAFTALYSFTGGDDGSNPGASMIQGSDGNLYGTAYYGGLIGEGSVYRIVLSQSGPVAVTILSPVLSAGQLNFNFQTMSGQSYTIQQNSNLGTTNWAFFSNFTGAGSLFQFSTPITNSLGFFRVREP